MEKFKIENYLHQQSQDISQGVDSSSFTGAGDQGIMFGYACSETDSLIPAPLHYSHMILRELSHFRRNNDSFFGPDSKSQVSMNYEGNQPKNIDSIVVSTQHLESIENRQIRKESFGNY